MTTFFLTIFFVGLLMGAMAIGVMLGRKPISGTCGGMKALGMEVDCEICGGQVELCEQNAKQERQDSDTSSVEYFSPK